MGSPSPPPRPLSSSPSPAGAGGSPPLPGLDAAERGFVLGMFAGGGADAGDLARALTAPAAAARCAEAARALAALPRPERVRLLGLLAEETLPPPLPPGIENVPPSVLARMLEAESDDTIKLILRGAPPAVRDAGAAVLAARRIGPGGDDGGAAPLDADDDVIAELQRSVFSSLEAVPSEPEATATDR